MITFKLKARNVDASAYISEHCTSYCVNVEIGFLIGLKKQFFSDDVTFTRFQLIDYSHFLLSTILLTGNINY